MKAAAEKVGLGIDWHDFPIGKRGHEMHGHTFPQATIAGLEEMHGWLLGPIGHSAYPRNDPTWIMPPVRKSFELFVSIKPVKSYPNIPSLHRTSIWFSCARSPKACTWDNVAAGTGEYHAERRDAVGFRVITRTGANRVAREAFEIARSRKRSW